MSQNLKERENPYIFSVANLAAATGFAIEMARNSLSLRQRFAKAFWRRKPLAIAIATAWCAQVNILLENKRFSAVRKTTVHGHTALHLAVACPSDGMIAALLHSDRFTEEAVTATNNLGRTALHLMTERGQVESAKLLRKSGKFPTAAARISNSNNRTALDIAKGREDAAMVALLEAWRS